MKTNAREHNPPIIQELLNETTLEQIKATEREMELIAFAFFILNNYDIKEDDGYHYVNSMGEYTTIHKLIQHYLEDEQQ
jgi:ethanolamine utilization cobalamin adenosyltransferase